MAVFIDISFFFRDNNIIAGNIRVRNENNRFVKTKPTTTSA